MGSEDLKGPRRKGVFVMSHRLSQLACVIITVLSFAGAAVARRNSPAQSSGLGSVYVNAQDAAERLQLNEADGSFSLVEGGQKFSGTYTVSGDVLRLHIAQLGKDVDIAIDGRRLMVNGAEIWVQNSAVSCSAGAGPLVCSDKMYNVSFRLPEGWSVQSSWRWGDRDNTVAFNDPQKIPEQAAPSLNYRARAVTLPGTPESIQETLQKLAESKVNQRRTEGIPTYHLRPESCQARTVGGHAARSCIAEFTGKSGIPMAEYLTFVSTANTAALFFGVIPVKGLDGYRKRFDGIIETLRIP
ncbi:MAG: hypothetical protein ABSB88_22345 [Bryobacteraceae bacterium]